MKNSTIMHSRFRDPSALRATGLVIALVVFALGCGDYGGGGSSSGGGGPVAATAFAAPDPTVAMASFQTTVHPLVTQYCGPTCHVGTGTPGSPFLGLNDVDGSYRAIVDNQKVNFSNPGASRLVRRLVADFHHCWSNCMNDGLEMEAAIIAWAAAIEEAGGRGEPVEGGLFSNERTLANGTEDVNSAERVSDHMIALYEFKEGSGDTAMDTSGVAPAMDLSVEGAEWMTNYGLSFEDGRAIATAAQSRKLYDMIAAPDTGTQQYSIEAWIIPDNTDQEGPARIVSYSRNTGSRNFTLGQQMYTYDHRNRNLDPALNDNGTPSLRTYDNDEDAQATLQHVVVTYDQFRGRRIFVNGRWTDDMDEQPAGRLWNWDPEHRFVLANEASNNRQWMGKVQLVAIYDHALTEDQISRNFDAGVGKRLVLSFDVSQWIGPGGAVEFAVREFDEFSYLFCRPTVVTNGATGFRISNLRIMVNGSVPVQGQAFVNVDDVVSSSRQELSTTCSIIPKALGADQDAFALAFEVLGGFEDPVEEPPVGGTPRVFGDPLPGEGIRDFARINETMSAVTGVPAGNGAVTATFNELTQQLPDGPDIRAFNSSHQVGVAKLALEYCDQLIESTALRSAVAPGFDFTTNVPAAYDAAGRSALISGFIASFIGDVTTQPDAADVTPVLDQLITDLTMGCTPATCDADRTRRVAKATCAAVLASGATTIH